MAAFVAVDVHADATPVGIAVDVGEQVQRLGGTTELGDGAAERRRPAAALEDAQQLGRADGAGGERAGDAEDVVPVGDDRPRVNAVAGEPVEGPVVGVAVDAPEALVGQRGGARAELVAQQPEQAEDLVGVGGLVGNDRRRPPAPGGCSSRRPSRMTSESRSVPGTTMACRPANWSLM